MKKLSVCLCCVLLLLTSCGKAQTVPTTEPYTAASQTETQPYTSLSESACDESETALTPFEVQTEAQTETQTETVTTVPQRETTVEPSSAVSVTTQHTQSARETQTLFTSPQRTTVARTTAASTTAKARTTKAATTTAAPTTTTTRASTTSGGYVPTVTNVRKTCTVTIDCRELAEHPEKLKVPEKAMFVPKSGYIVKDVTVELHGGESVYDVLRTVCATHTCSDNCRFCRAEGIQMESAYTPQFDSYYVEGIHQLYEKDCGGTSGWTYWVNSVFPNYGCSAYAVKPGDRIEWIYSIELDENESLD